MMMMKAWVSGLISFFVGLVVFSAHAQMPGFVSIDCGSTETFTDELGLEWIPDQLTYGETARVSVANETRRQYKTLRYFPSDDSKYCYTLNVETRSRYLLRVTFLYGIFESDNVYPKFDVWVDATLWSTIVISGPDEMETRELIFLALEPTVSVCLSNTSRRMPFISTLELRRFNGSMYYTDFENKFYLILSFRYNFGADSEDPVRYPDDPYDRIWEAYTLKRASSVAEAGTEAVSTKLPIFTDFKERAPQKVMQTALVGRNGSLTFLLELNGFPGTGWCFTYLAEIEDIGPHDVRDFGMWILGQLADVSRPTTNIIELAGGKRRVFQPGYQNVTLPFVLSFGLNKTSDSTMGPIFNAMETHRYIERRDGSADGSVIASFVSHYSSAEWAREGGDPCLPVPLSWLKCNSNAQPLVTKVTLSGKNLTGNIPSELTKLSGLEELWLSGNSLTGSIPDFSGCPNLKIIHLEDNQLTGKIPSSLAQLSNLRELYLQNNHLSGEVPSALMDMNLILNYTGNVDLNKGNGGGGKTKRNAIIGATIGVVVLLMATIVMSWILVCRGKLQGTKSVEQSTENYDDNSQTLNSVHSSDRLVGSPGLGLDGSIANPTRRPAAP